MKEIERKFKVKKSFKQYAVSQLNICQAYLNSSAERTVRVRISDQEAYITIKSKSDASGLVRNEWEYQIPVEEAKELLKICEPNRIEKIRYHIPVGEQLFEVDEFFGENRGLVIAEIELSDEEQEFEKPDWLGEEVTGDKRFYNSQLIKNPYLKWK